jgi:Rha family phage regulatory protein
MDGEQLVTDSRKVAAVHGKRHDDLLRLIRRRVVEAGEWGVRNFTETQFVGTNGETYPSFTMTKNGYAFLVGKMTGKKAVAHQIAYIEAFDAMAAYIKNQREGLQFKFLQKELEYKDKKGKVSGAAREMRRWQDDKPELLTEMDSLLQQMQPSILPN